MQTKVLITGASGQLGSEIVSLCISKNIEVVPMNRQDADIRDESSVHKFILRHEPTHIIHCAAWTAVDLCQYDPKKAMDINSEGTKNIVSAAKAINAHVTYISTDYVFDGKKGSPYTESDTLNPISIYGVTKLMGEHALRKQDAVARVSWLCGENGSNIVKTILEATEEDTELRFVNDQFGTPTFAEDAAKRILEISISNLSGIWHVSNTGVTSWYEFVDSILKIANRQNVKLTPISTDEIMTKRPARRPQYSALISERELPPMDYWVVPLKRLVNKLLSL